MTKLTFAQTDNEEWTESACPSVGRYVMANIGDNSCKLVTGNSLFVRKVAALAPACSAAPTGVTLTTAYPA
jgi:hypothetical protein